MVEHFYEFAFQEKDKKNEISFYDNLYELTRGKKSIVFSNARSEVEKNIVNLKDVAKKRGEPDVFMVHHGSISASDREFVEEQMRLSDLPLVTGATVTLELGIDLGDLERIIQVGCPKPACLKDLEEAGDEVEFLRCAFCLKRKSEVSPLNSIRR